jgi:ABC-type glycerol-3-phosphate transport system substrate-binding protein
MNMCKKSLLAALALLIILGVQIWAGGGRQSSSGDSRAPVADNRSKTVPVSVFAFIEGIEPDGRKTDPVSQFLEKKLNIELELTAVTEMDWPTQMAAMLAAGDLPDIFMLPAGNTIQHYQSLMQARKLLAIDPYIRDNTPYTSNDKAAQVMIESYKRSSYSPDGQQYIWGMCKGSWDDGTMPTVGRFILWDAYKKAGYPPLNSQDDLVAALEKMVAAQPRSISGEKTYAASGWFGENGEWGQWVVDYFNQWPSASVAVDSSGGILYISTVDSKPINMNQRTNPGSMFWQAMRFYNQLNQKGLLDPDVFTQTQEVYQNKLNDGRIMYNVPGWMAVTANVEYSKIPGETRYFISIPALGQAEYRYGDMYNGERQYVVKGDTKNPARCVALLDYLSSYEFSRLCWNGVEGMNWNMVNGKPVPTEAYLNVSRGIDLYRRTGAQVYHHFQGYGNGTLDPAMGIAVDLYQFSPQAVAKKLNSTVKDFLAHYGNKATLNDVYQAETPVTKGANLLSFGQVPDDIQNDINGLSAYVTKNYAKVIMARNDVEFARLRDEMIAGMTAFNPDRIFRHFYDEASRQDADVQKLQTLMK